jgi:predicted enzyme related to lactoylglutathione lyase
MIIDCQNADLRKAADFWSQALGMEQIEKPDDEPAPEKYIHLRNKDSHMDIEVQKVAHPSRVHLDIETDDVAAEVVRLEKLGAKVAERLGTWVVMEAPTGQRFCVVRNSRPNFDSGANVWK